MYGIRYRRDQWVLVIEKSGQVVSEHETRLAALSAMTLLYSVDPILAELDWAEQRIVGNAAARWRIRNNLGGTKRAVLAAARLADPTPLTGEEIAWLDNAVRQLPEHRHLSREMAGRRWPLTAAVKATRSRVLSKRLAKLDQRLGEKLYTMAVLAMREALRRAQVKATVRAKNRGKTAALSEPLGVIYSALAVSPDELLDRAFQTFAAQAMETMAAADKARLDLIRDAYDFDDEDDLADPRAEERRVLAVGLLVAGLDRRARSALAQSTAGDLTRIAVPVPFREIRTALRVRDGWRVAPTVTFGPNRTPQPDAEPRLVPPEHGTGAIDELLGKAGGGTFTRFYEWVHGYFGEPHTPFKGHLDLDGATYDDQTRGEVLAADPGEWPFVSIYSTDDHDDCTCYEVITYEPEDQ